MTSDWHVCRRCRKSSYCASVDMVQYSTRHWMHKACYIASGKPLSNLSPEQLEGFPFFALKEAGVLDEAYRLISGAAAP